MKATLSLAVLRVVLLIALLNYSSFTSNGQGTVNFTTFIPGELATRIYRPNPDYPFRPLFGNTANDLPVGSQIYGVGILGAIGDPVIGGYWAQLWAAPGADQPDSALQPASTIQTITSSGRVAAGVITLTGIPADSPIATLQVRVWQKLDGAQQYPTWPDRNVPGDFIFGKSERFNVADIGGGTNPAPNLLNLRSFSVIRNLYDRDSKPLIYVQPESRNVAIGGTIAFHAETALPAPNDTHWRFNGTNFTGAHTASSTNAFAFPMVAEAGGTLTLNLSDDFFMAWPATNRLQLTNVQPAQAGLYSLVVTNHIPLIGPGSRQFTLSSNAVLTVGSPGDLETSRTGASELVLNWDGVFILQSAASIEGPYFDLPGPVIRGPHTNSDFSGRKFFRLRN